MLHVQSPYVHALLCSAVGDLPSASNKTLLFCNAKKSVSANLFGILILYLNEIYLQRETTVGCICKKVAKKCVYPNNQVV